MDLSDITIEVRDVELYRLGQVRPEDMIFEFNEVFNNVGTWVLRLPLDHPMSAPLRQPGSGIVVTGPLGQTLGSGPMVDWVYTASAADPEGSIVFNGVTDSVLLADRVCYPDPTNINAATQTLSHDVRQGTAEYLMHMYFFYNLGRGAVGERAWMHGEGRGIWFNEHGGRTGPSIKKSARFQVLGDWLADIAILEDLRFHIKQIGRRMTFETFKVQDRSLEIRLDVMNGTLSTQEVSISGPTATDVIVAGQGDLTDRQFYAATSPEATAAKAKWGRRIERFLDQRQTEDSDEHINAANEVLKKEGVEGAAIRLVPSSDTTMRFMQDWFLGDRVAVSVLGGEVTAVVTGFRMLIDSSGFKIGVVLGDTEVFDRAAAQQRNLAKRVSVLERN